MVWQYNVSKATELAPKSSTMVSLQLYISFDLLTAVRGVLLKRCSQKFRKIHKKTHVNFAKFLRTLFLQNASGRLLLKIIQWKTKNSHQFNFSVLRWSFFRLNFYNNIMRPYLQIFYDHKNYNMITLLHPKTYPN